VEIDKFV